MADTAPPGSDADRMIARAIESVLDSVPQVGGDRSATSETGPKSQPWAETASPAGGNKRSLDDLLAEYAARVAAAPDAKAALPQEASPADAYLQRLSGGAAPKRGAKRRWRGGRRRRGGGGGPAGGGDGGSGGGSTGGGGGSSGSGSGSGRGSGGGGRGRSGGRRGGAAA